MPDEPHIEIYEYPDEARPNLTPGDRRILEAQAEAVLGQPMVNVCDFCSAPDPIWEYACDPIKSVGLNVDGSMTSLFDSDSPWAACSVCSVLVDHADLAGLARRLRATSGAYRLMYELSGPEAAEAASIGPALSLWRTFLVARTGDKKRRPPQSAGASSGG